MRAGLTPALAGLLLSLACPSRSPGGADATPAPAKAPPPAASAADPVGGALARPPHPVMATAAYGHAVLQAGAAAVPPPGGPVAFADGMARLASGAQGCESDAHRIFLQVFRAATTDVARVEAAAGVMLALVMDPAPAGYRERLTDAYGMQLYAASVPAPGTVVAPARALVIAAAGRSVDAAAAVKRVAESGAKDAWVLTLSGMARALNGDRSGALTALGEAVSAGQPMPRTFLERALVYWRLGDLASARADAEKALGLSQACTRCALVAAQCRALGDDPAAAADGLAELSRLSGPSGVAADAMAAAAVAEARAGRPEAADALGQKLGALKGADPEAALALGLAAAGRKDHEAALLALDRAAKGLTMGPLRGHALRALTESALAAGQHARALAALKALEGMQGQSAASSALGQRIAQAMNDQPSLKEERQRAYALDPYDAAVAAAVGRKPLAGGPALSAKAAQMWRLLGGGAPKDAMALARDLAGRDAQNPYPAWAMVLCQRELDLATPIGETPGKDAILMALDAMKRLGSRKPHDVLHRDARLDLLTALDEGERDAVLGAIKKFTADPDPAVLKLATEAVARPAPRPRPTAPTHDPR